MSRRSRWALGRPAPMLAQAQRNSYSAVARRCGRAWPSAIYAEVNPHSLCTTNRYLVTAFNSLRHRHLVVDTIDRLGNPLLPERISALVPRLKSVINGYWQLSLTEQDLAARESFHARAMEQSYAWMDSPGDASMDDSRFLTHWQAHHRHTCPLGDTWHAQWLSINISGQRDLRPSHLQSEHPVAPARSGRFPNLHMHSSARMPQSTFVQCHVGVVPPGTKGLPEWPLALMQVPISEELHFSCGDTVSDSWVSFLLLLSENASLLVEENMFPNKTQHGDRVMYGMTLERAVRFVADPTVSEITRHVRNTETQGIDVQLESIINRWGMKTISALCELHDEAHGRSRADLVCAHALRLS